MSVAEYQITCECGEGQRTRLTMDVLYTGDKGNIKQFVPLCPECGDPMDVHTPE